MNDDKKPEGLTSPIWSHLISERDPNGRLSDLMAGASATSGASSSSKRPRRRRKGYLNDGQWAPGYGPNAKKKREDK